MTSAGMGSSLWDRFEAEADHDGAVGLTRQWLEALPPGIGPDDLHQAMIGQGAASATLSAVLRSAGFARWADIVASMVGDDGLNGVLGKALLFRAGVQVVGSSERVDFLDIAKAAFDPLLHSEYGAAVDLAECFASDPEARARLEATLVCLIHEGKTYPNRLAWHPRPGEFEPVLPTTQNLWSSAYSTAMVRHEWAYAALRVDPVAYTRLLHALPVGLAHTTAMLSHDFALHELATLVGAAPSAFIGEGAPVASGALYALLERAHQTLANMDQASLAPSVAALVDAVLSRADAPWLGRAWGQRVLWEVSHHNATRLQTWPGLLFDALTARLEPLAAAESQSWIKDERLDLWRVDRVIVEAAILLDHDQRAEVPGMLEWALAEGLIGATGRERALNPSYFEANLLAQVFAGEDLALWFERVWLTGYPERERHRIGAYRKIDDTARSTLCWGLAALNRKDGQGHPNAWDVIFQALREMYLLDERYNWIGELGPSIFRFAAALCTAMVERGELAPDRLLAFLDLTVGPTVQFGGFIAVMIQQDEAATLAAVMASSPGRVQWALERGVLAVPSSKSQLTAEALDRIKAFSSKLS
jgi:hypothetical protein